MVDAILELRAVVENGNADEILAAIETFKAKATAGDLEPREQASEVAKAQHMLTVLAYMSRLNNGEGVQPMALMPDGEPAYFRAVNASRDTGRLDDDYGQLDITQQGIVYEGDKRVAITWTKVVSMSTDSEALQVQSATGKEHTFWLPNPMQAVLAHTVATLLKAQSLTARSSRKSRAGVPTEPVSEPSLARIDIGAGACNFNVVGESHYQGRLRNISNAGRSFTALVMPEPTNAVDPNAIRVVADGADTVAYLSKEDAVYYAPVFELLARHQRVGTCRALITGGTADKRSFGVLLNLRELDELLTHVRATLEPHTASTIDDSPF
jgi:hypothetical protein